MPLSSDGRPLPSYDRNRLFFSRKDYPLIGAKILVKGTKSYLDDFILPFGEALCFLLIHETLYEGRLKEFWVDSCPRLPRIEGKLMIIDEWPSF